MPNATRNQGDFLSPSKNVVSLTWREAIVEMSIRSEKYARMIIKRRRGLICGIKYIN